MNESPSESLPEFHTYIPLNKILTIQEAIKKLAYYHNSNKENILTAFMNLRDFNEGSIEFRESVNSWNPCIVMEGKDINGNYSWNHLINKYSGHPEMRCG